VSDYLVAFLVLGLFCLIASRGEQVQRWMRERELTRHTCPTRCRESIRCRCGCEGFVNPALQQDACAVCGTEIVYDYEDDTHEMPAPSGQTSWGWEREREERLRLRDE